MTRDELLKNKPLIIGGPCSVSDKNQILRIAREVKEAGADVLRAALWKPRTKPDSFQGVGEKGLEWLAEIKEKVKIPIATEILEPEQLEMTKDIVDIVWIGARNMQNFGLLKRVSKDNRPVVLKRGLISNLKEWLGSSEYIGRDKVILCERGIRTGADTMRFTLDFNAVLAAQHDYNMPVIVDPSHSPGRRDMVPYLAQAAIALGADGLMIETHYNPKEEKVDKDQTITTEVFKVLVKECRDLYRVVKKPIWSKFDTE